MHKIQESLLKSLQILSLLLLCICTISLLNGCASDPVQPDTSEQHLPLSVNDQIQHLLAQADNSSGSTAQALRLQAAELLMQQNQKILATQLLIGLASQDLHGDNLGNYSIIYSELLLTSGDVDGALLRLNSEQLLSEVDLMSLPLQINISDLRARALSLRGSHLASVQERIYIGPLLEDSAQIEYNQNAIWQSLTYLSKEELDNYRRKAITDDYLGWLELAIIAKDNQGDLEEQIAQLDLWLENRAQHPAAKNLPKEMTLLKEIAANAPEQIALLLPLSGAAASAGQAIQEGFLAAMYAGKRKSTPLVKIYDTERSTDFTSLYQQAVFEGAQLIIGPLTKERVRVLFDMMELRVPTLALNHIADYGPAPQQLYQFSLSADDESRQVAQLAYLENHLNAMILSTNHAWGRKAANAFSQQWQQLGGNVVTEGFYGERSEYSPVIKQLLQLDDSEQRARNLRRIIGQAIEFEPRRRQDIDMIFLLARPDEARSIKPMLAFHYGGDIPIYGTSHLYSGIPSPGRDADLNGIKFSDMPWILSKNTALKNQIQTEVKQLDEAFLRMYALGIDSYRLYPRLRQLEQLPESRMYGETGNLSLTAQRVIQRRLMWAQIRNGKVFTLPMIAFNDAIQDRKDAKKSVEQTAH